MSSSAPWSSQIRRLVKEWPLAWIVSQSEGDFRATPLPVRPVFGADGGVTHLQGHFARANPQVAALRRDPRALVLFMGPQGYISPSWLSDRTQAPTWNYAAAQFLVDLEFVEGETALLDLLRDLVGSMEAGRANAWRIEEMGPRYLRLATRIIGFRATVREARPAFKLGQAEPDAFFRQMLSALSRDGAADLEGWMADARPAPDPQP